MPETGGMLFPCTVKEELPPQRSEANEVEAQGNAQQLAQRGEGQNSNALTDEAKDRRKNPVKNFLE